MMVWIGGNYPEMAELPRLANYHSCIQTVFVYPMIVYTWHSHGEWSWVMRYFPINSSIPEGTRPGKHTKNCWENHHFSWVNPRTFHGHVTNGSRWIRMDPNDPWGAGPWLISTMMGNRQPLGSDVFRWAAEEILGQAGIDMVFYNLLL